MAAAGKWLLYKGVKALLIGGIVCLTGLGGVAGNVITTGVGVAANALADTVVLPTYAIGPEEIFSGKILLFDANIFNPKVVKTEASTDSSGNEIIKYYYMDGSDKIYTSRNNTAAELKDVISKWYYIIRNIALVGSMITLLYVGIRMMTSSVAEQKAKYKQMLSDWVVAICLIVLMHYIMVFAHSFTEGMIKILNNTGSDGGYVGFISEPGEHLTKAIEGLQDETGETYLEKDIDGKVCIKWPTNMMGMYRIAAQEADDDMDHVGYTIAYLVLVIFTLAFSISYIKRVLWLLFLTVISPFVALTYPLDKINDGKAQAFDMWLKEYIFNLLIQPFHLLLYTIFVSMSFELASTNIIYSLVVLGFMMPAEKFLRTMFGFNKASTPGMLGGATGAALTMSALGSLKRFGSGKPGGPGGHGADGKGQGKEENKNLRTNDPDKTQQSLYDDIAAENNNGGSPEENALPDGENVDTALERYRNDGYGQNANGDYFNPYTDEYDEDYDPHNDNMYNQGEQQEQNAEQIETPDTPTENNTTRRSLADIRSSIVESKAGRWLGATGKAAWKIAKPVAGKAIRYTANAATAATLGGIGIAAGIAAGDINAVTKNAAIGASTGVALSNGVASRVSNGVKNDIKKFDDTVDGWKKDYYGKDYEQKMRKAQDDKFKKDSEMRKLYKDKLGLHTETEIDKAMSAAVKYREYGVTDDKKIIKAMKVNNGNENNWADKKRIAAAKFAENSKNEKDLESNLKRFGETRGITASQVKEMKDMVRIINNSM